MYLLFGLLIAVFGKLKPFSIHSLNHEPDAAPHSFGVVNKELLQTVMDDTLAMENATTNSEDMIKNLTLEFNKARQAAITTEMLEIVSGAEALKE